MEIINDKTSISAETEPTQEKVDIHTEDLTTTSEYEFPLAHGEIIIEEITRNKKLLHRHSLTQNTINIGRDYHNDIILTDPHICPKHLSVNYSQGQWELTDHDSVNGTRIEKSNAKERNHHKTIIQDGDVIVLGKSQLRVLFKNHPVAKTVAFSPFEYLIDIIRSPIAVLALITLFMLIAANITYLNQPAATNISQLFVGALSKLLLFSLWPVGVSLVSHITKNDPRILAQLGVSFSFFILMWCTDLLEELIAFNTASNSLLGLFITLLSISVIFSLFWLNSYIGFQLSTKRRAVISFSMTVLLFGGAYLVQYSQQAEFNPYPHYDATIMAPNFLVAPSNSVERFIKDSDVLFEKANMAAQADIE